MRRDLFQRRLPGMIIVLAWLLPLHTVFGQDLLPMVSGTPLELYGTHEPVDWQVPSNDLFESIELQQLNWSQEFEPTTPIGTTPNSTPSDIDASSAEPSHRTELLPRQFKSSTAKPLTFADPIEFDVWGLAKWTIVALVIAGLAADRWRVRQSPASKDVTALKNLRIVDSLALDTRSRVHVVAYGAQQFMIAMDANGIRQLVNIPTWTFDDPEIDEQTSTLHFDALKTPQTDVSKAAVQSGLSSRLHGFRRPLADAMKGGA